MVSASNAGRNVAIAVVAGCATLVVVWLLLMLILITFGNALGHVFENISTQLGPTPGASY
jgi:threonine/homoserine/homoserine lactone efflux protein